MKYLFLLIVVFMAPSLSAQPNKLSDIPGKINGMPVAGAFKGVTGTAAATKEFNRTFVQLFDALNSNTTFARPIGFEVSLSATISQFQPQLGQKRYKGYLDVFLKRYLMTGAGFAKPEDHASSSIKIFLNPDDFFSRTTGFFDAYDDRENIPHPFQKIPVTDSTAYYTEYSFKGYGLPAGYYRDFAFRVLTASDRPVFIPFTRKQYLEYMIAVENFKKKEAERKLEQYKKDLKKSKEKLALESKEEMKKMFRVSIEGTEEVIKLSEERIKKNNENISAYQLGIHAMSDEEKKMTAYVDLNRSPHPNTEKLVPAGRREGDPMYVLNPDFYDDALPPTKTQAIVIAYWHSARNCPEYMKENVKRIFDGIDYQSIKNYLTKKP